MHRRSARFRVAKSSVAGTEQTSATKTVHVKAEQAENGEQVASSSEERAPEAAEAAARDDDVPPKPLPSFNGALSKFAFAGSPSTPPDGAPAAAADVTTSPAPTVTILTRLRQKRSAASPATDTAEDSSSSSASTAKKKKRKRSPARYAPPSKYAHLSGIPDALGAGMLCLFIGLNPGIATARSGHAYSSPSNSFWKMLHSSGLTPDRRLLAAEDMSLPALYSLGNTNLVGRPTKNEGELSKEEMDASVAVLEEKVRRWRPESVCIVGKGIWESIWRAKKGRKLHKNDGFEFGWQEDRFGAPSEGEDVQLGEGVDEDAPWEGARVFVTPSTSGLVAGYSPAFKEQVWRRLGDWVQARRAERGETAPKIPIVRTQVDIKVETSTQDEISVQDETSIQDGTSIQDEIVKAE